MGNSPSKNSSKNVQGFHENLTTKTKGKLEKKFEMGETVGKGSMTSIQVVRSKKFEKTDSRPYAMKLYDGSSENKPNMMEEANVLRKLDHPNIVKLYGTHAKRGSFTNLVKLSSSAKQASLILELCQGGDLTSRYPYTEERCSSILRQILSAVAYLHDKRIIHRDINVTNILFESQAEDSEVKLIDFGCATELPMRDGRIQYLKEKTGNVYVMAPEVIKGRYSLRADMWSIGVVAYMLIQAGKRPFDGKNMAEIEKKILACHASFSNWKFSKKTINFVEHLLIESPYRSDAKEALKHEWIEQSQPKIKLSNELISSFQLYSRYTPLKRMALNVLAKHADIEKFSDYRKLFRDLAHTKQMGTITKDDFKTGFEQTGFSDEELNDLFLKLDINRNGEIMLTEFLAATMETKSITREELQLTFDTLDEDNSGLISKKNLLKVLGSTASDEVTKEIEDIFDNRPQVSFQDFVNLFGFIDHNIEKSITEMNAQQLQEVQKELGIMEEEEEEDEDEEERKSYLKNSI